MKGGTAGRLLRSSTSSASIRSRTCGAKVTGYDAFACPHSTASASATAPSSTTHSPSRPDTTAASASTGSSPQRYSRFCECCCWWAACRGRSSQAILNALGIGRALGRKASADGVGRGKSERVGDGRERAETRGNEEETGRSHTREVCVADRVKLHPRVGISASHTVAGPAVVGTEVLCFSRLARVARLIWRAVWARQISRFPSTNSTVGDTAAPAPDESWPSVCT